MTPPPSPEALIQRLRALSGVFASVAEHLAGLTSDARLEYGRNELLAWERDGALLMTEAADALSSSQEALRAKDQEIQEWRTRCWKARDTKPCEVCEWPQPIDNEHFICECCGFQPGYDRPESFTWNGEWWAGWKEDKPPRIVRQLTEALRAAESKRDEHWEDLAEVAKYEAAESALQAKEQDVDRLCRLTEEWEAKGAEWVSALQAKEQEIARLRAALKAVECTARKDCWCDRSWDAFQYGHQRKCQFANEVLALASSGAETP